MIEILFFHFSSIILYIILFLKKEKKKKVFSINPMSACQAILWKLRVFFSCGALYKILKRMNEIY